jgi:hypothetical protein
MADDKVGWEIDGRFYPHNGADSLRHGDYALIREVTGLTLDTFDMGRDPLAVETGWLAVAIWQADPGLSRGQVVEMVERLPRGAAKPVGWTKPLVEADEDDAGPPDTVSSGGTSSTSDASPAETDKTTGGEEQTQESSILNGSGSQASATGHTLPLGIS